MANLDTRNKRGSAIGIDFPSVHVYPNPDGTIDQLDRQQISFKYAGIAADAPIVGGEVLQDFIMVGIIPFPR